MASAVFVLSLGTDHYKNLPMQYTASMYMEL